VKRSPSPRAQDTVLTTSEVAAWLKVSERTVERHFASFLPGRYLVSHVLARIEEMHRHKSTSAEVSSQKKHPDCVAVMCGKNADCGHPGPCYADIRQKPAA